MGAWIRRNPCLRHRCLRSYSSSILNDKVDGSKPVTVQLLGGDLNISWERDENLVYMTGPATTVFDGEIDLGFLGE